MACDAAGMTDFSLSEAEFRALHQRLRRMAAQGAADRLGTLNNISAAEMVAAASDVRAGRTVSLSAPSTAEGVDFPVHVLAINAMGLYLLDYLDLGPLTETCAAMRRWSFLCVVAPLRLRAGTGSPVNPIAIF
jgi:kynurenine formamidase